MDTAAEARTENKTEKVTVLLSPAELEAVRKAADETGRSVSGLLRYLALRIIGRAA